MGHLGILVAAVFSIALVESSNDQPTSFLAQCYSDPHCTTFDGFNFDYQGDCDTVFFETCHSGGKWPGDGFRVIMHSKKCPWTGPPQEGPSCVYQSTVEFPGGLKMKLWWEPAPPPWYKRNYYVGFGPPDYDEPKILITDSWITDTADSWINIRLLDSPQGKYLEVKIIPKNDKDKSAITINFRRYLLQVVVNSEFRDANRGQTCGLAGNNNGQIKDDANADWSKYILDTPSGCVKSGQNARGWRKKRSSQKAWRAPFNYCRSKQQLKKAAKACGIINEKNGPFKACYDKNPDRQLMFENCINDVCVDKSFLCDSLDGYAAACAAIGVCNGNWRKKAKCRTACPKGMKYTTKNYDYEDMRCIDSAAGECDKVFKNFTKQCKGSQCKKADAKAKNCMRNLKKKMRKQGDPLCMDGCRCTGDRVYDYKSGKCVPVGKCSKIKK